MATLPEPRAQPVRWYATITKVDPQQRIVGGIATDEQLDSQGDIVDWEATKAAVAEYARWRNIREMHQPSAVGRATTLALDDQHHQLYIEAKIVDDEAWQKVVEQVYQGFSIGGEVLDYVIEPDGSRRITAYELTEISVVDRPANPRAVFTVVKRRDAGLAKAREEAVAVAGQKPDGSFEALRDRLNAALDAEYGLPNGWGRSFPGWIVATYPDHLIVEVWGDGTRDLEPGKYYQIPYTDEDGDIHFGEPSEVQQAFLPVEAQKAIAAGGLRKAQQAKAERDQLREEAEARAKRYGIGFKDGKGHLTPPKGYPTDPDQYGDPVNYAYPIDAEHIRAAVSYFNHPDQRERGGYTAEEWAIIGRRIAAAANRHLGDGYRYADGRLETPDTARKEDTMGKESTAPAHSLDALRAAIGDEAWEALDVKTAEEAVQRLREALQLAEAFLARERQEAQATAKAGSRPDDEPQNAQPDAFDPTAGAPAQQAVAARDTAASEQATEKARKASNGELDTEDQAGDAASEQRREREDDPGSYVSKLAKKGAKHSRETLDHLHTARDHLLRACGCDKCAAMLATHGDGVLKDALTERPAVNSGEEANPDHMAHTVHPATLQKALGEAVSAALAKAGPWGRLEQQLGQLADRLDTLDQKVQAIADTPLPGGPMLKGGPGLVGKGFFGQPGGPRVEDLETVALEKLFNETTDPLLKDHLGQHLAKRAALRR